MAERFRARLGRGVDHFERAEPGLAQQLKLLDVAEPVEIVDEPAVAADGDGAAAVLVVVHEPHPATVIILPRHFVLGRPVEPVGTMVGAARALPVPKRRQRIFVVPGGPAHAHEVAVGGVGGGGGAGYERWERGWSGEGGDSK